MPSQIVDLNGVEAARIGFRQARGAAFNCDFVFRNADGSTANMTAAYPQLVFRPRSKGGASAYDIVGNRLDIPGAFFSDPHGYSVEMYSRDSQGQPTALIAHGTLAITGGAYEYEGPLFSATLPTGPQGERGFAGPPGPQGARGGTWTTGPGDPVFMGTEVEGDMWLNETNGDVWRYSSGTWSRGTF